MMQKIPPGHDDTQPPECNPGAVDSGQVVDVAVRERVEKKLQEGLNESMRLLPDTWAKSVIIMLLQNAIETVSFCFGDAKKRGRDGNQG